MIERGRRFVSQQRGQSRPLAIGPRLQSGLAAERRSGSAAPRLDGLRLIPSRTVTGFHFSLCFSLNQMLYMLLCGAGQLGHDQTPTVYCVSRCSGSWHRSGAVSERGTATTGAPVAQWIEHLTSDQRVGGSNPSGRAKTTTCCG